MQLIEILFFGFIAYLGVRFIFGFLLPVVRATRQVREQFRNMQDGRFTQDQEAPGAQAGTRSEWAAGRGHADGPHSDKRASGKAPAGDYIDFEEVK